MKDFRLSVQLHNRYHYLPLSLGQDFDLLSEKGCNRGLDEETQQTIYYLHWYDKDLTLADQTSKVFCLEAYNYKSFNAVWEYDKITDPKSKQQALEVLFSTVKKDMVGISHLAKTVLVMSKVALMVEDGDSENKTHPIFLRVAASLTDAVGVEVNRVVDVPLTVAPVTTFFDERQTLEKILQYSQDTMGEPPENLTPLPSHYLP